LNQENVTQAASLLSVFIKSIDVKIKKAEYREVTKPFFFSFISPNADALVCFNKGVYFQGKEQIPLNEGSFYFIPRGQRVNLGTGPLSGIEPENVDIWKHDRISEDYTTTISAKGELERISHLISFVSFESILYNAFPFFPLLELPSFSIPPDNELTHLMREMCIENEENRLGKDAIIKNYLGEIVVLLFRYIESRPELRKPIEKLNYLTDVRLINIVKYIEENLDKELTNTAIAGVAHVSDDYVGQFFKSLTERTLQDYIEQQRLDRAMQLLKTIPNSVQEVAAMVGFKDTAYFSRRFRMRFDVNANAIRQGKAQLI
jgi:AraC-like DNA-binding protein